jgi:hypothetical protein
MHRIAAIYTALPASTVAAIEIAGVVIAAIFQIPKEWPTFANERRDFAGELDPS